MELIRGCISLTGWIWFVMPAKFLIGCKTFEQELLEHTPERQRERQKESQDRWTEGERDRAGQCRSSERQKSENGCVQIATKQFNSRL